MPTNTMIEYWICSSCRAVAKNIKKCIWWRNWFVLLHVLKNGCVVRFCRNIAELLWGNRWRQRHKLQHHWRWCSEWIWWRCDFCISTTMSEYTLGSDTSKSGFRNSPFTWLQSTVTSIPSGVIWIQPGVTLFGTTVVTTWVTTEGVRCVEFFNNGVIISSLVRTGNCKLGHDWVCSHRRHDETRQIRRVGVGGVYWASGLKIFAL